ncbi:hypothetical protein EIN_528880, partial [Entamoeba invadens IP1]
QILIVVLGEGYVGKSSCIIRLITGSFPEVWDPIIEDIYNVKLRIDDELISLNLVDTASNGWPSYLQKLYVSKADGFLMMYSIDDYKLLNKLIFSKKRVPIVLCGNKIDREERREVSKKEGKVLAESLNAQFLEISTKKWYKCC